MKQFLIIPLGGIGKRFQNAGYKIYKPFLNVSKKKRVIDNIINNFPKKNTHIIVIGNEKKFKTIVSNLSINKITFIKIKNHKYGPVYSLFLAKIEIKKIIKDNNFFVSYSDINWLWNYKIVQKFIKDKNVVIFSHKGFHPHLEIDSNSDFFLNKNNFVTKVSEKKKIISDYKKNNLAIGCYYFQNFDYFEKFFDRKMKTSTPIEKEIYIINVLKYLISTKIMINYFEINKFVHLGIPYQYENFIFWQKMITEKVKKKIKSKFQSIMLMGGVGKRVGKLKEKKPFIKFKKTNIYEYIFDKINSKKNYIITNDDYTRLINKKFKIHEIKKTNSMFQTVEQSLKFMKDKKNFFILSCDCFGNFDNLSFKKFIKINNPDVIIFPFKITNLQKTLSNAHSTIEINTNKLKSINVKKFINKKDMFGHAGFFWVKNSNVFNHIDRFNLNIKLNREVLLDDYFKFLFDKKICNVNYFMLNEYIHIGSIKEYLEFKYWENYFEK